MNGESKSHNPSGVELLVNQTRRTFQSISNAMQTSPLNLSVASWSMRVLKQQVEEDRSLSDSDRDFLVQLLTGFAVAVESGKVTPVLVQDALRKLDARQ